ncbi:helix-turn-helix domain-containing protein [Blastococcus xanthinilyticus]|uniref:Excisionase family DNA binding protein n=1 Tax=Blastococcus xanthinilyticus TaxID=1564164 RepID=A0A5S5CNL7_9ACTN|nr:helix-turn-helix domain-containing protein [Blastococcus xanthinilyticus]TYP82021.1 excisionase family DNA binding protein [Blastococcus xanthinilyticus]
MSSTQNFTASIELDTHYPAREDEADALVTALDRDLEVHGGMITRSPSGRVRVVVTLQAADLRTAAPTALAIAIATGHQPFGIEVLPTDEFYRRLDTTPLPELLSVTQAGEALGVSRQRALQLVTGGKLQAVKVGDTWVIPRSAVAARDDQQGHRFTGLLLPIGVVSDTGQLIEDQAVDVARHPLPVFDEQDNVIGLARSVSRDDEGWTVTGALRGLPPGTYAVAARVDQLARREDGDVTRIEDLRLTGFNVLTTRQPAFPQAQIEVLPGRSYLDLRQLVGSDPAEVFTYP